MICIFYDTGDGDDDCEYGDDDDEYGGDDNDDDDDDIFSPMANEWSHQLYRHWENL